MAHRLMMLPKSKFLVFVWFSRHQIWVEGRGSFARAARMVESILSRN